MVFMCLDHTREFFGDLRFYPEDLETTTTILFYTRWITHFCAPTFVFLAGVSAWLYGQKVSNRNQLAMFLLTRGLWLLFLEFTVVHFAWLNSFGVYSQMFIIIAAIGACMVSMSILIFLPYRVLVVMGIGIVFFHNVLDPVFAEDPGWLRDVWVLLHQGGHIPGLNLNVGYPVLAWIGVMLCGYVFGPVLQTQPRQRIRRCLSTGAVCCALFLIVRGLNSYGDRAPWTVQEDTTRTIMSFLNCTKYPPSLSYVLMTLGPSLIVLGAFDAIACRESAESKHTVSVWLKPLVVFGKVPLFFYVVHLYLIHGTSRLLYWVARGKPISPLQTAFDGFEDHVDIYGFDLWVVYVAWPLMLAMLFPLCLWFGRLKARGTSRLWSYL